MKFLPRLAVLLFFSTFFAIAQQSTPTQTPPAQAPPAELPDSPVSQAPPVVEPTGPTAVLDTSMGRITCRFFDKQAPLPSPTLLNWPKAPRHGRIRIPKENDAQAVL